MDAVGAVLGVVPVVPAATVLLGREYVAALAIAAVALLVLGAMLHRQRRRSAPREGPPVHDKASALKERLRRRLAEPAEGLAAPAAPGPTVGASEAIEADLDAAAKQVLPEAGWRRGAAKQLLRRHLNGHAPNGATNGAANGAEAAQWRQLGALALLDDVHDALAAYRRAADLAPDDQDLQLLLGVLHLRTGGVESAEAAFRRQIGQVEGKDGCEAIRYRAGIMLGDALLAKGARGDALAAYEAARKEVLALAEREPANRRWRRDASVAHDRIGDLLLLEGQADAGLECFQRSLEIARVLAKDERASSSLQHDLSVAHDRVGEALEMKGDLDGALRAYRRSLAIAGGLMKRAPENPDWRWDVTVSLDRIGDVLAAKDRAAEAVAAYRRGLQIAEALVAHDPTRLQWQRDVAVSCHKIGMLEAQLGRAAEAREALEQGRTIIARLAHIARYQAQWRADLSKFESALHSLVT